MGRLVIDGNKVYEIDEKCLEQKRKRENKEENEKKQREEYREKHPVKRGKYFL